MLILVAGSDLLIPEKLKLYQCPLPAKRLRSSNDTNFDWKNCCFLCEKQVSKRNRKREDVTEIQTIPFRDAISEFARKRDDKWGQEVLAKVQTLNVYDVITAFVIYFLFETSKKVFVIKNPFD